MTDNRKEIADRAMALFEQKSPHQLAVELVSMEDRLQAAIDACARMQEQRDHVVAQLEDATRQCGVMAELLRDLREGAEIHLHNCTVCKNADGIANWTSKLERIDAALAGKLPAPGVQDATVALSDIASLQRYTLGGHCDSFGQDCGAEMEQDDEGEYILLAEALMLAAAPKPDSEWSDDHAQLASQEDYRELQRQHDELQTMLKQRPYHTLMAAADMLDRENSQLARLNGGKVYISTGELRTVAQMMLDGRLEVPTNE